MADVTVVNLHGQTSSLRFEDGDPMVDSLVAMGERGDFLSVTVGGMAQATPSTDSPPAEPEPAPEPELEAELAPEPEPKAKPTKAKAVKAEPELD